MQCDGAQTCWKTLHKESLIAWKGENESGDIFQWWIKRRGVMPILATENKTYSNTLLMHTSRFFFKPRPHSCPRWFHFTISLINLWNYLLKYTLDAHLQVVLARRSLGDARGQIVHAEFWHGWVNFILSFKFLIFCHCSEMAVTLYHTQMFMNSLTNALQSPLITLLEAK